MLEEPETFDAELIQEEQEEAKREAEKSRPGLVMFTDGSRLESGAAGYAVAWKKGQTWKVSRPTWGTTRRPLTRSVQPWRERWKQHEEEIRSRSESPFSPTPRQRSGGWRPMNRDQDRNTRLRRESTSLRSEGQHRASSSKSGGAPRTRGWKEMRRRMSGQSSQRKSRTLAGWKG